MKTVRSHPLTKPIPSSWEQPLRTWESALRTRGLSERTIDTRIRHVRQLARQLNTAPHAVTAEGLIEWCGDQAWMPETRHGYYASFRLFFEHLAPSGKIEQNPASSLVSVRRPLVLPRPTPEDIVRAAITEADPRTALILTLAASLGLRAHEIARVRRDDIHHDLYGMALTVRGKGGKERSVPLAQDLARRLLAACADDRANGFAFPGQIDGHLSARWISKLASHVLPKPWTLHTLRHRFATKAYSANRDLIAVQRLLGHSSVATTQRYAAHPQDALWMAVSAADLNNTSSPSNASVTR